MVSTLPSCNYKALPQSPSSPYALANIPTELINFILSYLSPLDLAALSSTCRRLYKHATSDNMWRRLVQENIPGSRLTTSYPFRSYRELYAWHDTKWFLPKHKIWFCDCGLAGKLLLARYDQWRGCIEAYQLVANPSRGGAQHWLGGAHNWLSSGDELNHSFGPRIALRLDKPVVNFAAKVDPDSRRSWGRSGIRGRGFVPEVPMAVKENSDRMFCNFLLAKPIPAEDVKPKTLEPFPYGSLWPPPAIPAPHRVIGSPGFDEHRQLFPNEVPARRSESSNRIFRIRQQVEPAPGAHIHQGEQIITYSTLDPVLYTPTPLKPWRGIWVGEYGGHGYEFLLIHQPEEDLPVSDEQLGLVRGEFETEDDWETRRLEKRVYSGQLEGIKLTGDSNVPRGDQTFVVDDLSDEEYGKDDTDGQFLGARVVPSLGRIARTGFQDDEFVDTKLMLISYNRLAQRWMGDESISFFERVDIDRFLDPKRWSEEERRRELASL